MQTKIQITSHANSMLIDLSKAEMPTLVAALLERANESNMVLISVSVHVSSLCASFIELQAGYKGKQPTTIKCHGNVSVCPSAVAELGGSWRGLGPLRFQLVQ